MYGYVKDGSHFRIVDLQKHEMIAWTDIQGDAVRIVNALNGWSDLVRQSRAVVLTDDGRDTQSEG